MTPSPTSKIASVTLAFWVMKIAATTLGETGGDLVSTTLGLGYATSTVLLMGTFIVLLASQIEAKKFHPWLYWGVILATSTAGTTMSDLMDRTLGLGYAAGSLILLGLLLATLFIWKITCHHISVNRIASQREELFYWAAILFSNTLGTAAGDFLADSSGLGYATSNLLITGIIAAILLAYKTTKISHTALFWGAFVLTRPFGATMGDLLTKPLSHGGMGFGTYGASAVLGLVLVGTILYTYNIHPKGKKA